jgi:hypothetical protein
MTSDESRRSYLKNRQNILARQRARQRYRYANDTEFRNREIRRTARNRTQKRILKQWGIE